MPAYDEAENLRVLLPQISSVLDGLTDWTGIIHVVLRREATPAEQDEVRALGAIPWLRGPTDSFGDAMRTGIVSVPEAMDFIAFMDADGSHDPATLPLLLEWVDANDVVIASRYVAGGRSDNGPVLRAMSRSLNLCFRLVLGIPCEDLSTNFKVYRREALQDITLTCDKFDVVEEILFRLQRRAGPRGLRVHEVPDYFRERLHGESKRQLGPFVASYLVTLMRLRMTSGN